MKSDMFSINIPLIEELQRKPKMFEISNLIYNQIHLLV